MRAAVRPCSLRASQQAPSTMTSAAIGEPSGKRTSLPARLAIAALFHGEGIGGGPGGAAVTSPDSSAFAPVRGGGFGTGALGGGAGR